jgi:cyclopropane fatty-acyl-phospholipid synthase-like methyltransferase
MFTGKEQIHNPSLSLIEKCYVFLFGMPIIGLRIRCRNILSLIPDKPYRHILDAGSGSGVLSFALGRKFSQAHITGLDLDPDAIKVSRAIASSIGCTRINFINHDIETFEPENQYDLIICIDILEHIKDDQAALRNLYHALRPEGTLILHVPALFRRYPVWKKQLNFDVPTHVRYGYKKKVFEDLVQQCGFLIKCSGFTYGFLETLANNMSYMITRARKKNRLVYALAFPILNLISLAGRGARPEKMGSGLFAVAVK